MDTETRVQILDKPNCISHSTTIGKGMNPIILPTAMDNSLDRLDSLALIKQPV